MSNEKVKEEVKKFGFDKVENIALEKYDAVIEHLRSVASSGQGKPQPQRSNQVSNLELIDSLALS